MSDKSTKSNNNENENNGDEKSTCIKFAGISVGVSFFVLATALFIGYLTDRGLLHLWWAYCGAALLPIVLLIVSFVMIIPKFRIISLGVTILSVLVIFFAFLLATTQHSFFDVTTGTSKLKDITLSRQVVILFSNDGGPLSDNDKLEMKAEDFDKELKKSVEEALKNKQGQMFYEFDISDHIKSKGDAKEAIAKVQNFGLTNSVQEGLFLVRSRFNFQDLPDPKKGDKDFNEFIAKNEKKAAPATTA